MFVNILGTILAFLLKCCKKSAATAKSEDADKFEMKVQQNEMEDDIELFQILKAKGWYKNESVVKMTENRLRKYQYHISQKSSKSKDYASKEFSTLASYNFRVRLTY